MLLGEKFGRVYYHRPTGLLTSSSPWKEIPFACFSNWDLTWYGADGNIHVKFKQYQGYRLSLGFTLTKKLSDSGESETFRGKLDTPFLLGEDTSILSYSLNQKGDTGGFPIANSMLQKLAHVEGLEALANFIGVRRTSENDRKLLYYVLCCVFCDSLKNTDTVQKIAIPHQQLFVITEETLAVVQGYREPAGVAGLLKIVSPKLLRQVKLSQMGLLQQGYLLMGQVAKGMREGLEQIMAGNPSANKEPFIRCVVSIFEQGCIENCNEFREANFPETSRIYKDIHYIARGYQLILEAAALEIGIDVENDLRHNYLFQKFLYHFVVQIGKLHDIFSMGKTLTISLSLPQQDKPFQEMMRTLVQEANDNLQELLVTADLLITLYDDRKDGDKTRADRVSSFVVLAKQIIRGFIQWQTQRHPHLVYDCHVGQC